MGEFEQAKVIKSTRATLTNIFKTVTIEDWNQIMTLDEDDEELGLNNPYSKICCFILQLYTMEIGTPSLYNEVNRVAREMDMSLLEDLGPYLKALSEITSQGEKNKKKNDKIKTGLMLKKKEKGVYLNIGGAFLLWRGS